jgi:hypothetical protein
MWSVLIGLVERWWRDKPRKEVVRAVVLLRDTMIDCHRWYVQYLEAVERGDLDFLYPNPEVEWTRSLTELVERVADLDTVLSIFSPEAHEAIRSYINQESLLAGAKGLEVAAQELGSPLEIDIANVKMEKSFTESLNQLRTFIAANFKADEVFAAHQSKWR